ncbi:MAG: hypothetical protein ISS29_04980 [Candidatus Marinimicrobia bacterium]|nr:hypothetical protein [Candidatus Neomarinimicrobiota bacterium]
MKRIGHLLYCSISLSLLLHGQDIKALFKQRIILSVGLERPEYLSRDRIISERKCRFAIPTIFI